VTTEQQHREEMKRNRKFGMLLYGMAAVVIAFSAMRHGAPALLFTSFTFFTLMVLDWMAFRWEDRRKWKLEGFLCSMGLISGALGVILYFVMR
jgi:hypothetical protein